MSVPDTRPGVPHVGASPPVTESSPPSQDLVVRLVRALLAAAIGYLILLIFWPFLRPLAWASIVCFALYPVYRRLLQMTRQRQTLSALLMSLLVTIAIFVPALFLSLLIGEELARTYQDVVAYVRMQEGPLLSRWEHYPLVAQVITHLEAFERQTGTDMRALLISNLTGLGRNVVQQLTAVATNVLVAMMNAAFISITSFFFFRDGDTIVRWLRNTFPIRWDRQELILRRFDEAVMGAIYGNFVVSLLEGFVGGMAFFVVGLPAPILWGSVMAILAYLPMVGAGVVWLPAALYLVLQGAYWKMAVLVTAGTFIVLLDYILRNKLVADRVQMHSLLVFFSVLGGIQVFGLLGIIAGPLLVVVGRTLIETYWQERVALTIGRPEVS